MSPLMAAVREGIAMRDSALVRLCLSAMLLYLAALMAPARMANAADAGSACSEPVTTSEGPVSGAAELDSCAYKGIPYAAPPVGELRYRRPAPAAARGEVLVADEFGPWCMQKFHVGILDRNLPTIEVGEDCLHLNIWRPKKSGSFPVMFFMHGGGLLVGSGSTGMYQGQRLASAQDVVVVTINYRLGSFGFFSLPELAGEDPEGSSGNQGLLDQVAALKWVRANIAAFGGDPDNITIFGESAGGWSVCNMLVSPLSRGLFHRAIIQSGGCDSTRTVEEGYRDGRNFAEYAGCGGPDVLDCMRDIPAGEMLSLQKNWAKEGSGDFRDMMVYTWLPKEDGKVLMETPIESLRAGRYYKVPVMAGTTRDEGKIFTVKWPGVRLAPRPAARWVLANLFGEEDLPRLEALYPYSDYKRPADAVIHAVGDSALACKVTDAADALAGQGPVHAYRFDFDGHLAPDMLGASHAAELPFIFDTFDKPDFNIFYTSHQVKRAEPLTEAVMSYWANFARTGDPNGPGLPEWPAYDSGTRIKMFLDVESAAGPAEDIERCEFWREKNITLR